MLSVPAGSYVLAQGAGSQPAAVMVNSTSDERVWSVRSDADEYPGSPHLPVVWGRSAGYTYAMLPARRRWPEQCGGC